MEVDVEDFQDVDDLHRLLEEKYSTLKSTEELSDGKRWTIIYR